jgi:MerR family redox-sensitive transcriptional activator SoxR
VSRSTSPSATSDTPRLSIGQLAAQSGVATSAIRYYESVGLLQAPVRRSGYRRYDDEAVRLLSTLKFAQRAGFSIAEIRTLFHGFGADTPPAARWRAIAEQKMTDLDALIADAKRMRRALENGMACGCVRIEDCVSEGDNGCCLPGEAAPAPVQLGRARRGLPLAGRAVSSGARG